MFNSKENELVHTSLMAAEAFKTASALRDLMYEYATSDKDKEWLKERLDNSYVGQCTVEIIENWLKDRGLYGTCNLETFNAVLNHEKSPGNHYFQTRVGSTDGVLFNNDKTFKDWLVSTKVLKKSDPDNINIVVDDDGDLIVYLQILDVRTNEYLPAYMPAVSVDRDILSGFLFHGNKEPNVVLPTPKKSVVDFEKALADQLEEDRKSVLQMDVDLEDPIVVTPEMTLGEIQCPATDVSLYGSVFHTDITDKGKLINVIKSISEGPWMLGLKDGRLLASQAYYRKLASRTICESCGGIRDVVPKLMPYEVHPIKGKHFTHRSTLLSVCTECGMDCAITRDELERVRAFSRG